MNEDNCLVKVQGEDGKTFDMLILNEFSYKERKYAILTELDSCMCGCDDDCNCAENKCTCGDDCDCTEDNHCGCKDDKNCTCGDDCNCAENECTCGDDCNCTEEDNCGCKNDEPALCLLEITKDEEGKEIFKSIDDENLFNELVLEAEKILYKD